MLTELREARREKGEGRDGEGNAKELQAPGIFR